MKRIALLAFVLVLLAGLSPRVYAQDQSRLDAIIKSGKIKVCSPGDYKPFSLAKPDGTFEGIDIDLIASAAKALGVEVEMVKTSWPKLMDDFLASCDVAVGGISVSTERAKRAGFTQAYMINGKAPITKCENVSKFQTVADINKATVTVITNPAAAMSALCGRICLLPKSSSSMTTSPFSTRS